MSEKMIVACPECQTRFVAPLEKFLPDGRKVRCAKCGHSWFQAVEGADAPEAPAAAPPPPVKAKAPTESIMDRATRATDKGIVEIVNKQRTPEAAPVDDDLPVDVSAIDVVPATAAAAVVQPLPTAAEEPTQTYHDTPPMDEPEPKRGGFGRFLFYTLAAAIIAGAVGYFFKDPIAEKVPALDPTLTSWQGTVDGVVSKVVPPTRSLRIENVKYDIEDAGEEPAMLLSAEVVNDSQMMKDAPELTVTIFGPDNTVLDTVDLSAEDLTTEIAAQDRAGYFLRMPYPPADLERVEVDFADK